MPKLAGYTMTWSMCRPNLELGPHLRRVPEADMASIIASGTAAAIASKSREANAALISSPAALLDVMG